MNDSISKDTKSEPPPASFPYRGNIENNRDEVTNQQQRRKAREVEHQPRTLLLPDTRMVCSSSGLILNSKCMQLT